MRTKIIGATFLALLPLVSGSKGWGEALSVPTVPPVVIRTVPEAGAKGVDPKLSEIKVTFSKGMMDQAWSWVPMSKETFPQMTGKPRYLNDNRTCILPVKLYPGTTYAIWINSDKFGNFRDSEGRSAIPYLLVFETRK